MELRIKSDFSSEKAEESIRDIIGSNRLCSLATVDGSRPHIATAFFAFDDDLKLYILTEPDTEHGQHLEENSSIALSIYDSHQEWMDDKQGVQLFGTAEKIEDGNAEEALQVYMERFPELEEFASSREELKQLDSSFYRVTPERIKIFDEVRFGKETWVVAEAVE